ncbi:MAG: sporulation protein YunB [Desulfotomaculales bacterium]
MVFKRKRRAKPVCILLALFLIVAGFFLVVEQTLLPTILAIAEAKAVQIAVDTMHSGVRDYLKERHVGYEDFINIHKDRDGRAVLLQVDATQISEISADLAVVAENRMATLHDRDFAIPLGQIIGSQLLASYGPRIKVRLIPVGHVKVDLVDKFEEAGINQTRHRISLNLNTDVRIVIPWQKTEVQVAAQVPLVDSIILGNVPATYVSIPGGLFGTGRLRLDTGEIP